MAAVAVPLFPASRTALVAPRAVVLPTTKTLVAPRHVVLPAPVIPIVVVVPATVGKAPALVVAGRHSEKPGVGVNVCPHACAPTPPAHPHPISCGTHTHAADACHPPTPQPGACRRANKTSILADLSSVRRDERFISTCSASLLRPIERWWRHAEGLPRLLAACRRRRWACCRRPCDCVAAAPAAVLLPCARAAS